MASDREALAAVLTEHRYMAVNAGGATGCRGCAWTHPVGGSRLGRLGHESHVADAILASDWFATAVESARVEALAAVAALVEVWMPLSTCDNFEVPYDCETTGKTLLCHACRMRREFRAVLADHAAAIAEHNAAIWDECVQAFAWAKANGSKPLNYVANNNPYRTTGEKP